MTKSCMTETWICARFAGPTDRQTGRVTRGPFDFERAKKTDDILQYTGTADRDSVSTCGFEDRSCSCDSHESPQRNLGRTGNLTDLRLSTLLATGKLLGDAHPDRPHEQYRAALARV